MHLVASDKLAELGAQAVVRVGRDVVELVHRDQPAVECLDAQIINGETERCMGADQHFVVAGQEFADRLDL